MNTELKLLIAQEQIRQEQTINLTASENYVSHDVLTATGSVLTNKYAEGYPGKRYYGGCQAVDSVEDYARNKARELFGTEHANVQPHSGSSANMAVYFATLQPEDTVLGMHLASGGHLTHGHSLNFSGKLFNFVSYGVSPQDERIDYEELEILADQNKPKMIVAGASSYARAIDFQRIAAIAKRVNAIFFVDMAHIAGPIAAGLHQNPAPYADIISSTTHKTLRGPRGGMILSTEQYATAIDKAVMPGTQGGPLMHVIAAKAVAFDEALTPSFKKYQEQILKNAKAMANEFKNLGYRIVSGGTDTHLFLVDLRSKFSESTQAKVTGNVVEKTLEKCNIVLNRNMIPFDPEKPLVTSGIRIGTPAITTRGLIESDARTIVHLIDEAIHARDNEEKLKHIRTQVIQICANFPINKNK